MALEREDISTKELLRRIDTGDEVFAWWPVQTYTCLGWYTSGWVWLKPVMRKRCVGIRKYYYAKMPTHPNRAADQWPTNPPSPKKSSSTDASASRWTR